MAINVNTVYTTVLAILNKEQRGYLTPYEFNTLAKQAQLEIFEKYFDDLNVQLRSPQNTSEYADRVKTLQEKINAFETSAAVTVTLSGSFGQYNFSAQNPAVHRFGMLEYTNGSLLPVEVQKVPKHEFLLTRRSQLTAPTSKYPICYIEGTTINILPGIASVASVNGSPAQVYNLEYVKKPVDPVWGFTVGTLGQYIYDSGSASVDFDISSLDQSELILKILTYAGVVVRDPEIVQAAAGAVAQIDNQQQQ
tara:strand:+ start:1308 stop:2060 length:753 start_codon:yes stop_codon:yes gene_type:complete